MSTSDTNTTKIERISGPLAFLADIHGNLPALDAVIAQCRAANVSGYFVAGDLVFRGDQPLEVWKRLLEIGAHCARGTSDLALGSVRADSLKPTDEVQRAAAEKFQKTQKALGELILARLRTLPPVLRIELNDGSEIAVTHGSPKDPTEPITHDLSEDEVSALLGDDGADLLVCGGSHVPFDRTVSGMRIVGVGSVGESPEGRVAHYTLIEPGTDGFVVDQRWVAY